MMMTECEANEPTRSVLLPVWLTQGHTIRLAFDDSPL